MSADLAPWIAIAIATAVTFGTRTLGPVIMARVPSTKRIQQFLDSLSTSVIVAIVAGFLAQGTLREAVALAAGALAMMLLRRPMLSMAIAMVVTAHCRRQPWHRGPWDRAGTLSTHSGG